MDHPEGFLKLVKDAKKRIKEEDYREVKKKIDSGHPLVLVDTREDSEWARGHIPGAVHLSKGIIERAVSYTHLDVYKRQTPCGCPSLNTQATKPTT